MKKMMILTLALLGSIAVVQPVEADPSLECEMFVDPFGCDVWICPDVLNWHCPGQPGKGTWPMP